MFRRGDDIIRDPDETNDAQRQAADGLIRGRVGDSGNNTGPCDRYAAGRTARLRAKRGFGTFWHRRSTSQCTVLLRGIMAVEQSAG